MHNVLLVGAGKIGSLIALLLDNSHDYRVFLADIDISTQRFSKLQSKVSHLELIKLDVMDGDEMRNFLRKNSMHSIVSSLPFFCNITVAGLAREFNLNYFDLTEDTHTAETVAKLSLDAKCAFVPQCGLAPGFISVVTNSLMERFPELDTVKMRVGALPINISNGLQYTLTWSTDGLINEYGNLCNALDKGEEVKLLPLDDLEEIKIDGLTYEAFNTSGGIGSLVDTYRGRVKQLSYKTIRYPGHCANIRLLMNDLKLNEDRGTLKKILENAIPKTGQDVVLVYSSVTGIKEHQYLEENYVKKFYPKVINDISWSAIQLTTASELCAILDLVVSEPGKYMGLVKQEHFSFSEVKANRFGHYFN